MCEGVVVGWGIAPFTIMQQPFLFCKERNLFYS